MTPLRDGIEAVTAAVHVANTLKSEFNRFSIQAVQCMFRYNRYFTDAPSGLARKIYGMGQWN